MDTTITDITTTDDIVTTVSTSLSVKDTSTTATIGSSGEYLKQLNESAIATNQFLAFIVLLLICGWLYSFLNDLFNQV